MKIKENQLVFFKHHVFQMALRELCMKIKQNQLAFFKHHVAQMLRQELGHLKSNVGRFLHFMGGHG